MARIETATPPPDTLVLDIFDQLYANKCYLVARRGGAPADGAGSGLGVASDHWASVHSQANAGTVTIAGNILDGIQWWTMTGAAGAINGRQGMPWPIGRNYVNAPAGSIRPLRWITEGVMLRAAIVAGDSFGHGFRNANNSLALSAAGQGIALESSAGTFGGNWAIYQRNLSAGALTSTDLGIVGTDPVFYRWIYDDTDNPRLQLFVNGASVLDLTGVANIPRNADASSQNMFAGFFSVSQVGTVDRIRQCRWKIETLVGFD